MISRTDSQRSNGSGRPFSSTNPFRSALTDNSLNQYGDDQQFLDWTKNNGVNTPLYNDAGRNASSLSFVNSIEETAEEDKDIYTTGRVQSPLATRFSTNSSSMAGAPLHAATTNPFLEDALAEQRISPKYSNNTTNKNITNKNITNKNTNNNVNQRVNSAGIPNYNNRNTNPPTAAEEKERLRQSYMESDNDKNSNQRTQKSRGSGNQFAPPSYEEAAGPNKPRSAYTKEKSSSSEKQHSSSRRSHRSDGDKERNGERRRHNSSRTSSSKNNKKGPTVIPKNVDSIDKLDVTGLFGGSFHHDGPFDAVTPHRNKNSKAAPVMAFPVDGPNSTIGGAISKPSTLNEVFGRDEFADDHGDLYRKTAASDNKNKGYRNTIYMGSMSNDSTNTVDAIKVSRNVTQFDAKSKGERVSGPTTIGLGSTTFLDGAPASTNAIQDEIRNQAQKSRVNNGLKRNKSLSQRLNIAKGFSDSGPSRESSARRGNSEGSSITDRNNTNNDDDDVFIEHGGDGVRFDSDTKKESTSNKFLRRVKSLKVTRK